MAIPTGSRSLWISAAAILICLWLVLQSSTFSNRLSTPVSEPLSPAQEDPEPAPADIKTGADIFRPGDAIPASAWEHGLPTGLEGAPDNDLYEAGHAENKKPPVKTTPSENIAVHEPCPICPEIAEGGSTIAGGIAKTKTEKEDRPLILYAYYESEFGRQNLQFFVDHGLHAAADFVFILNGETDVDATILFKEKDPVISKKYGKSNIFVRKRANTCFDLGAHAEVLNGVMGGVGWHGVTGPIPSPNEPPPEGQEQGDQRALKDRYKRYILMNASIRGPFVPLWSNSCWSDAYLNKVTSKIKLVGMSYNCHTNRGHVQSMIWATDSVGLSVILSPGGISECFPDMPAAQEGEVRTTKHLRDNGYDVDVFMSVYHSKDAETKQNRLHPLASPQQKRDGDGDGQGEGEGEGEAPAESPAAQEVKPHSQQPGVDVPGDFWKSCTDEDWLGPGSYFGTFVHPYENLFMKSHRHIEDTVLDRLTEWHDGWGYRSYDICH